MIFQKNPTTKFFYLLFTASLAAWLFWALPTSCNQDPPPAEPAGSVREILGADETCMNCHADYTGFATAHDPQVIGCTPCHGGQPLETEEAKAHSGMKLVPGNLSDVHQTCGAANCHGDIAHRVDNSLMTSMAGVITVNRFVFGESDTLSAWAHVQQLGKEHAADVHLRQLCASCHLGAEKTHPGMVNESSRGGGCIACHLDYSQAAYFAENKKEPAKRFHPAINLKVTNDHCFGCHSRSGRISTNYEGWHETKLEAESYGGKEGYRLLADGRIFQKIKPDVHHELGLECIDCHSAKEVMGDGNRYLHEEDAVKIRCGDCHFTETPPTAGYEELDLESKKIMQLRGANFPDARFMIGMDTEEPIWNVIIDQNGQPKMVSKNSGKHHPLLPPADICTRGTAHDNLTCNACHTDWAPQCVGCHNTFDQEEIAFDHLDQQKVQGKWIEHLGEFFAEQPTLGVVEEGDLKKIMAFIPGMIMTVDKSGFPGKEQSEEIFQRLFAPVAPHTTNRKGRTCESCHQDPLALGYGRGALGYKSDKGKGRWQFISEYANLPEDNLPQDAWIGFLDFPKRTSTTRPNARPFTVAEQKRILRVGACLTCHAGTSPTMLRGLDDFDKTLKGVSERCVLPVWE